MDKWATSKSTQLSMDLSWHALNLMLQVKILYHNKSKDLATCGFPKNFQIHPPKPAVMLSPVSERSAYSLQNYICFSPLTSGLESFGHKSMPSDRP